MDALPGWRPDPFGLHEFRFFSLGGRPTRLVSDDNFLSVFAADERLPVAAPSTQTNGSATAHVEPSGSGAPVRGVVRPLPANGHTAEAAAATTEAPARPTRFCAHCGTSHKDTATFCPGCGQRISSPR